MAWMSVGEIIGLVAAAVLAGFAFGASVASLVTSRRDAVSPLRERQVDAYARWLAARLTMSRTSMSFVAAFRALAAEPHDSPRCELRTNEAQRARADWCDAMRELDLARATLIAWNPDPQIHAQLARFDRVATESLKAAINGDQHDVDMLTRRLRLTDQAAIDFVGDATIHPKAHKRRDALQKSLSRTIRWLQTIVDHWREPPP